ncbi:MAG: hypothetical protein FWD23_12620 [Oscillospiraceae bacterium]|nr:hypothetical protein [Oscillospiraceae bacterium]
MTQREMNLKTLLYKNPEKIPFSPGGPRESTIRRWHEEGLPENMSWWDYVREKINLPSGPASKPCPGIGADQRMIPIFEEKIIEHKTRADGGEGTYIIQDWMGSVLEISDRYDYTYIRNAKDFVTRRWIKCPVETYGDWLEMKKRYDSAAPQRVGALTPEQVRQIGERDSANSVGFNGPFWQLREWLGFEGLCTAMIERPEFVAEMIGFWQDFILAVHDRIFAQGVTVDIVRFSEDMAYKAHSMISPAMTREFLLPVYKKWVAYFKSHGAQVISVDSDGCVEELIPIWIEAGINVNEPLEVAAHNDIVLYSSVYKNKMGYTGGVDKRAIAAGGKVIEAELKRLEPVINKGGYIPSCDHGVPSDISLDNFIRYSKLLAKYTGWL